MPDNIALQSQQFAADRSREGNAYRMQGAETMRQGLSSLVPGFQQAQRAQLDNMHATNELGMDELRRQESVQTLQFAQELHRTKMSRAQSDAALSAAELQIAQNNAAMKKLESEGYEKRPEWEVDVEQRDKAILAGWKWTGGGPRGLGKMVESSDDEKKAAQARIDRAAREKSLGYYIGHYGGQGVDYEGVLNGTAQVPVRPATSAPGASKAREVGAALQVIHDELESIKKQRTAPGATPAQKEAFAKREAELNVRLRQLGDMWTNEVLGGKTTNTDEPTAGDDLMKDIDEIYKALLPGAKK